MSNNIDPEQDIDPRLMELSREYLSALESGTTPDRNEYLSRFPDLKIEAEEVLDGIQLAFEWQRTRKPLQLQTDSSNVNPMMEPIGDFRIIKEIGRGGMGIVYEAVQRSLGRSVALKVLPFAAAMDDRHRKRFLLEAQAAAQLHHNHIVPVFAVGCERGTHYYAMQLIHGHPVSAKLFDDLSNAVGTSSIDRSANNSSQRIVRDRNRNIATIVAQAADGLDYAHSCGVVHRDVKPGNLLLDLSGKLWITDFGLAYVASNDQLTQTGDLLGTMRYMSPEQASGHRSVIDHRTDIYSLGATLYELLVKQPVFIGSDRQTLLNQILNEDPIPPRQIDRTIPIELETIALKALQHSAADRYASAQEMADDLRRYLIDIPIRAKRPTVVDKARKWMRRHPSMVLASVFAMFAALILLAAVTLLVTHQKSLTTEALYREQRRASQAERRLSIAQSAADEMIRMGEEELSKSPMESALRQRLLSSALVYYKALIEETSDNSSLQADLQATRDRASKILDELTLIESDSYLRILREPQVQIELSLTDEQTERLHVSHITVDDQAYSISSLEQARERQKSVIEILTSDQRTRLKQVSLQLQGPMALRDLIIAGELRLTSTQASLIRNDILSFVLTHKLSVPFLKQGATLAVPALAGLSPNFPMGMSPDDFMSKEDKRELMQLLLTRLSPQQLEIWSQLTGPKVQWEL
jgi:eukaryotic-like serine/threonine-protein kinase